MIATLATSQNWQNKTLAIDIIKYIIAKFFFMATPKGVVGCLGDVKILLKGIAWKIILKKSYLCTWALWY